MIDMIETNVKIAVGHVASKLEWCFVAIAGSWTDGVAEVDGCFDGSRQFFTESGHTVTVDCADNSDRWVVMRIEVGHLVRD